MTKSVSETRLTGEAPSVATNTGEFGARSGLTRLTATVADQERSEKTSSSRMPRASSMKRLTS